MGTVAQTGVGISILGDVQSSAGHDPEQAAPHLELPLSWARWPSKMLSNLDHPMVFLGRLERAQPPKQKGAVWFEVGFPSRNAGKAEPVFFVTRGQLLFLSYMVEPLCVFCCGVTECSGSPGSCSCSWVIMDCCWPFLMKLLYLSMIDLWFSVALIGSTKYNSSR